MYRDIFCTEYNLSFFVPRKDQCLICAQRNAYVGDNEKTAMYENHIRQKDRAQQEKQNDKERCCSGETCITATFDMESILQLPASEVGPLYYKRKLVLHNFTVYESVKPNHGFCYLWPETSGRRGANEIGTCLYQYLQSIDPKVKHVTFFSDSCTGQNRNQYVCSLMLYAVTMLPVEVIDHKFLVPGHTMMECDSMHSSIEYAHKNLSVYSVHEWVNVLKSARRHNPYAVQVLDYSDFYDLKTLASKLVSNRKRSAAGITINWLDVRWIRVQKSMPNTILFKTDFDQPEFDVMTQKRISRMPKLMHAYQCPLPISAAKYTDLVSMLKTGIIPEAYMQFYQGLPHNSKVVDCIPEQSECDDE